MQTLDELAAAVAGTDLWNTPGIPGTELPPLRVTDGPNGAAVRASPACRARASRAARPLGATWDPELVARVGAAIGEEARTKGAHVLLAPTVNLHRHPLAGRNFECYSEDPYLTARLAVGFVRGVQSIGVGTTVKHFVANDSEFERMTISSEVDEAVLRELYLVPFEAPSPRPAPGESCRRTTGSTAPTAASTSGCSPRSCATSGASTDSSSPTGSGPTAPHARRERRARPRDARTAAVVRDGARRPRSTAAAWIGPTVERMVERLHVLAERTGATAGHRQRRARIGRRPRAPGVDPRSRGGGLRARCATTTSSSRSTVRRSRRWRSSAPRPTPRGSWAAAAPRSIRTRPSRRAPGSPPRSTDATVLDVRTRARPRPTPSRSSTRPRSPDRIAHGGVRQHRPHR